MQSISLFVWRKFLFTAAGMAVLMFAVGRCQAATLNVPSANYPTIQAAISTAVNGDTITVAAGTYPESISWNATSLTLQGAGAGQTIIDPSAAAGDPGGRCMTLSNVPSTANIEGFTFQNGNAYTGGGISNTSSSPTIINCSFSGNVAGPSGYGGGIYNYDGSSPTIMNCAFSGNSASGLDGGGMYNGYHCSPAVIRCTFSGNSAGAGGGMFNTSANPTVTNCSFSGNTAAYGSGMLNDTGSPTVTNCSFSGNSGYEGGGMRNDNESNATVTNCSFSGNTATYGGALDNRRASSPTITNCIFWGDTGAEIYNEIITFLPPSSPTITYSDVQGGYSGTGNINADPLFVRNPFTNGPTDYGDLRLQAGSPCIDAGDVAVVKSPPFLTNSSGTIIDLDGNPRIENGAVDMGAYEFQKPPIANPGSNQVVEATGPTTPVTLDGSKSSDPDGDTLSYRWADSSNTTIATTAQVSLNLSVGTYTYSLTVTDPSGSSGSASVQVTVQDTTPPTISGVPSSFNVAALKPTGSVVTYTSPTAADRVDGTVAVTCTPASGSTFPLGVTTVTCTATDAARNKATATFQVNVTLGFRPPVLRLNPLSGATGAIATLSGNTVKSGGSRRER